MEQAAFCNNHRFTGGLLRVGKLAGACFPGHCFLLGLFCLPSFFNQPAYYQLMSSFIPLRFFDQIVHHSELLFLFFSSPCPQLIENSCNPWKTIEYFQNPFLFFFLNLVNKKHVQVNAQNKLNISLFLHKRTLIFLPLGGWLYAKFWQPINKFQRHPQVEEPRA